MKPHEYWWVAIRTLDLRIKSRFTPNLVISYRSVKADIADKVYQIPQLSEVRARSIATKQPVATATAYTMCIWFTVIAGNICKPLTYGAVERSRTSDLLITNQLLYQLSYNSLGRDQDNYGNYSLLENGGQTFPIWERRK